MSDMKTEASVPSARESGGKRDSSSGNGQGTTHIADGVVAKIAGMAAREIGGVHAMGGGAARMVGAVRDAVSGGGGSGSVAQGVSVEVGERQTAVDIDLVVEYGAAIQDLAAAVRRNVTTAVERMTGLEVTEINIKVDDIHLPEDDNADDGDSEPRVR
ncbi:Asp23/Gls24 family envelope stress response protein [Nocardiopsis alba]|uniref:Asp23/Gls24 family envelope stress response protein n=2 Tax=Nocardiopsis alba TaxID=53437 RepID=A0A7K2IVK4_9ACTN|nr:MULTISPECIES: Asp23/Gls24 family envelope stress response protein [Nocardiopsis]MEC3894222.1 Asp23/Gls24 family envelope stress response protein [Nocardiopsis sp. LDBS1602]MYR34010.1 Asp23/Gls24 family envelope stress response protein [Nocardiopsis alba]